MGLATAQLQAWFLTVASHPAPWASESAEPGVMPDGDRGVMPDGLPAYPRATWASQPAEPAIIPDGLGGVLPDGLRGAMPDGHPTVAARLVT